MRAARSASRLLMAGIFLDGGLGAYRDPQSKVAAARPIVDRLAEAMPGLPADPATMVKLNASVQLGAAGALALGIAPRLAALTLAGSLVPTTLAGHRFWDIEGDPARRSAQRIQFLKNAAMLGGLLLVALD